MHKSAKVDQEVHNKAHQVAVGKMIINYLKAPI